MSLCAVLAVVTTIFAVTERNHIARHGPRTRCRRQRNPVIICQGPKQTFGITAGSATMTPIIEHKAALIQRPSVRQPFLSCPPTLLAYCLAFRVCLMPCLICWTVILRSYSLGMFLSINLRCPSLPYVQGFRTLLLALLIIFKHALIKAWRVYADISLRFFLRVLFPSISTTTLKTVCIRLSRALIAAYETPSSSAIRTASFDTKFFNGLGFSAFWAFFERSGIHDNPLTEVK